MNLNVFLVEDEIVVREGISNKIKKNNNGFNLCGEAQDGEMALSMIYDIKPDIIITDIKMPFMDGLELSRIVKKSMPWIKIIILSGYDEFDYAKEAISIGVTEYLVKPIDSEELFETLNRVSKIIYDEHSKEKNLKSLKEKAEALKIMKQEKLLNDLVLGILPSGQVIEYVNKNGLNLVSRYYQITLIEVQILNNDFNEFIKIRSHMENIKRHNDDYIITNYNLKQFILIVKGSEFENTNNLTYKISKELKEKLESKTESNIKIGIGSVVSRLTEISESFLLASRVLNYMNLVKINKIMDTNILTSNSIFELIKLDNDSIRDKIKHATKEDLPAIINEYLKNINDNPSTSMLINHYIYTEILLISSRLVISLGGSPQSIFKNNNDHFSIISNINTKDRLYEVILNILNKTIEFRDTCEEVKYGNLIKKAKEYMDSNISEPDLNLKTVAKIVSLSPNHFSSVFSQETGETFIEYLTKLRVSKAKRLLKTTNLRSSDITFNVGYREPHYFSYIFKKHTGLTPRDYRNKNKKN